MQFIGTCFTNRIQPKLRVVIIVHLAMFWIVLQSFSHLFFKYYKVVHDCERYFNEESL